MESTCSHSKEIAPAPKSRLETPEKHIHWVSMKKGLTSKAGPKLSFLSVHITYFKSHTVKAYCLKFLHSLRWMMYRKLWEDMPQSELTVLLNTSQASFLIPAGWYAPVVPGTSRTDTEGFIEPGSSNPYWEIQQKSIYKGKKIMIIYGNIKISTNQISISHNSCSLITNLYT